MLIQYVKFATLIATLSLAENENKLTFDVKIEQSFTICLDVHVTVIQLNAYSLLENINLLYAGNSQKRSQ